MAPKNNNLIARVDAATKKIHDCIDSKRALVIKQFWLNHADDMRALLDELNAAGMKKEYAQFDHLVNQVLYKAVLINKSIRLAKDMGRTFTEKTFDSEKVHSYEKRSKKIETEMKRMGFYREASMHLSLFRLHLKEEKKELEFAVSKPKKSK